VERHGLERADRKVPQDLKAYDYVLQARAVICDSPDNNRRCRELYESALRVDPHSAAACCGISMAYGLDHTSGWSGSPEWCLEQAISYALKAVALDDDSSEGHVRLGSERLFNSEYELAEFHLDKALKLNPNYAGAWAYKGLFFIYTGKPEDALCALEQATRRNPFHYGATIWMRDERQSG
jgi:tetratricopeptide (TPR) repeat protein